MRYLAVAFDYDGTLATDGQVSGDVIDKLKELIASRRQLILVTGRQLENLAAKRLDGRQHPSKISADILDMVDVLIAIGTKPEETIQAFAEQINQSTDKISNENLDKEQALVWFKDIIKDDELAQAAAEVESNKHLSPEENRQQIRSAIEERYTVPA